MLRSSPLTLTLPWILCWLGTASLAHAELTRVVDHDVLVLADAIDDAPDNLSNIELGPAPPYGGTRLLSKSELVDQIRAFGGDPWRVKLPNVVRITRASKRWSTSELELLTQPTLEGNMPHGVSLLEHHVRQSVTLAPRLSVGAVKLPKLPKQPGPFRTTALVELKAGAAVAMRVPVSLVLNISAEAAEPTLAKGAAVTLIIEQGRARISANAVALADTDLNQTAFFRVVSTRRVLKATLISKTNAKVVSE